MATQRGASLSPASMVDSVADWSLVQVVNYLKKREKDGVQAHEDTRLYCRSSIRFLNTIVTEVAREFGVSRGKMYRCLSYHGASMLEVDTVLQDLVRRYYDLRRMAIEKDSPDIADIINAIGSYTPREVDASQISFLVYDTRVLSSIEDASQACGVFPGQLAQVLILRSLLTCDLPDFSPVLDRLRSESRRWDLWMKFRLSFLEIAVASWESLPELGTC